METRNSQRWVHSGIRLLVKRFRSDSGYARQPGSPWRTCLRLELPGSWAREGRRSLLAAAPAPRGTVDDDTRRALRWITAALNRDTAAAGKYVDHSGALLDFDLVADSADWASSMMIALVSGAAGVLLATDYANPDAAPPTS